MPDGESGRLPPGFPVQEELSELTERLDFTEKLLMSGDEKGDSS